jgi:CBS domain containing-hemolysin-like protein
MQISDFIEVDELIIDPYTSIQSIEHELLQKEYVVIKDQNRFIGILTVKDLVKNYHQLAIDCYTPKPFLPAEEGLDKAFTTFLESESSVLPVQDKNGSYIGSVTFQHLLKEICYTMRGYIHIQINNITGTPEIESAKRQFVADMLHNIKNPIQTILSAAELLSQDDNRKDFTILLNAIVSSAKQVDELFNHLYVQYFE